MAAEGTLMELTSRGKKDAFFIQNPQYTWFGGDYERRSATTRSVLTQYPASPAQFGSWVEIELPRNADILKHFDIHIAMPTWLPQDIAAQNFTHTVEIESDMINPSTGLPARGRYGWSNGIADNVVAKWELYADTNKLCEGYGIVHSIYYYTKTTQARAPLYHQSSGYHDGSNKAIQRAATPPVLSCRIPLPGCQWEGGPGLPLCALLNQRLYVRVRLAPKEDLAESSRLWTDVTTGLPVFDVCPAPWGKKRIFVDGVDSGSRTVAEWELGQPHVHARCTVLHIDDDARDEIMQRPLQIPYHRYVYELLNFDEASWQVGRPVAKVLDVRGFFDAIYIRFWHEARDRQNKYRDTLAPGGYEWVNDISLIVNGVDRIFTWDPKKLRQLSSNTQLPRDIRDPLYYMIFGEPKDNEPAGTLFLSRTHKAVLRFTIGALPADPAVRSKFVYVYLMGVAWNILDVQGGQARTRFAD